VIADCNSDEAVDAADVVMMLELLSEFEEGD
jgi:hypothetical protein